MPGPNVSRVSMNDLGVKIAIVFVLIQLTTVILTGVTSENDRWVAYKVDTNGNINAYRAIFPRSALAAMKTAGSNSKTDAPDTSPGTITGETHRGVRKECEKVEGISVEGEECRDYEDSSGLDVMGTLITWCIIIEAVTLVITLVFLFIPHEVALIIPVIAAMDVVMKTLITILLLESLRVSAGGDGEEISSGGTLFFVSFATSAVSAVLSATHAFVFRDRYRYAAFTKPPPPQCPPMPPYERQYGPPPPPSHYGDRHYAGSVASSRR